jgi:hypothetical protein
MRSIERETRKCVIFVVVVEHVIHELIFHPLFSLTHITVPLNSALTGGERTQLFSRAKIENDEDFETLDCRPKHSL